MKTNKGFTLIELTIVIALVGIIVTLLFMPMTFSLKTFGFQNEKANLIADERLLMDYLTREIRKATSVGVKVDENEDEGGKKAVLVLDSREYKFEDGKLFKDDEEIAEGIENLSFEEKVNEKIKEIKIEIEMKDSRGKPHKLSSTITIR